MTIEQIRTFLTVLTYGNITNAAKHLFITQSNVSKRIASLEEELGGQLFVRQKGHKNVELTNFGQAFYTIATQWAALYQDTNNLKHMGEFTELTIASVDAVNNFTFVPFFNEYMQSNPHIQLFIQTFHSNEIHSLIEKRAADLGFVYSQLQYPDIISKPVYRELLYLVCRKDSPYSDGMENTALDPADEIHLSWSPQFEDWYQSIWGVYARPMIRVNTGSMLPHYFVNDKCWAIAPKSVITALSENHNLTFYGLKNPPPPRICYLLMHKYPRVTRTETIEHFVSALEVFIKNSSEICIFEPWMLNDQ